MEKKKILGEKQSLNESFDMNQVFLEWLAAVWKMIRLKSPFLTKFGLLFKLFLLSKRCRRYRGKFLSLVLWEGGKMLVRINKVRIMNKLKLGLNSII